MANVSSDAFQGILLGLLGGPILLNWGLRKLNEKRFLENIPTSKVRSAAIGLIELKGQSIWRKPLHSPLSNKECCWWKCKIQEYRRQGKSSRWVTIHQVGSLDLFYLRDDTGQVLVNPEGADLNVPQNIFELNAMTRTHLSPVLKGWGIQDMSWFGFEKRLRVIEELIYNEFPLFVIGELANIDRHLEERQARMNARLKAIKSDAAKMAEADHNRDGQIDAEEWDAFRQEQESQFMKEEISRQAAMPNQEKMLLKAPSEGVFLVSTRSEEEHLARLRWTVPLFVIGGLSLSGFGVKLALVMDWAPLYIVGLVATGLMIGQFLHRVKLNLLRR